MAYDKVIDSAKLKADLTTVADAIRAKGGTTEKLDFPDEYVTAVEAIESGGLDTSDATATPDVVVKPYTYYANGEKQTGKVHQVTDGSVFYYQSTVNKKDVSGYGDAIVMTATAYDSEYFPAKSKINVAVRVANFGDATASDVVKGKTFTSSAGVKVEGTYEPPVSAGGVSF